MQLGGGGEMQFRAALALEKRTRAGIVFARAPLSTPVGCVAADATAESFATSSWKPKEGTPKGAGSNECSLDLRNGNVAYIS